MLFRSPSAEVGIPGIVAAQAPAPALETMRAWIATLEQGLARNERPAIYGVLRTAVPDFKGTDA